MKCFYFCIMKIKVCGITKLNQILSLSQLHIDWIGLNFYALSPRFVGHLPPDMFTIYVTPQRIGIFVNESSDKVCYIAQKYQLHMVQLHGNESLSSCEEIRKTIPIIKVIAINMELPIHTIQQQIDSYVSVSDYLLFDTASSQLGGSGIQFSWDIFKQLSIPLPFFLSGGISSSDAIRLKQITHPNFFAVDINSKFEIEKGVKDIAKIDFFKQQLYT